MEEGAMPDHYMAGRYVSRDSLDKRLGGDEREQVYREMRDVYDDNAQKRLLNEKTKIRHAMASGLKKVLDEYQGQLKKDRGDEYGDHLGLSFHHLDDEKIGDDGLTDKKRWTRKAARKITRAAMETTYKAADVDEYMKDQNRIDEFIAAHLGEARIDTLEKFAAELGKEEEHDLFSVVSGAPETANSNLSQFFGAYAHKLSATGKNQGRYLDTVTSHVNEGDNYLPFLNTANTEFFHHAKHDSHANPHFSKSKAIDYWRQSGRKKFALPEGQEAGLVRNWSQHQTDDKAGGD